MNQGCSRGYLYLLLAQSQLVLLFGEHFLPFENLGLMQGYTPYWHLLQKNFSFLFGLLSKIQVSVNCLFSLFLYFLVKHQCYACYISIQGSIHILWMRGHRVWNGLALAWTVFFHSPHTAGNKDLNCFHSTDSYLKLCP